MSLDKEDVMSYPIKDIPLSCITKITLSPKLPESTYDIIKEVLKDLIEEAKIKINRSQIFKSEEWISGFKKQSTIG